MKKNLAKARQARDIVGTYRDGKLADIEGRLAKKEEAAPRSAAEIDEIVERSRRRMYDDLMNLLHPRDICPICEAPGHLPSGHSWTERLLSRFGYVEKPWL